MEEQTTTQKIAQLKQLGNDVKANMYQRVKLAAEILADVDWIEHAHHTHLKNMKISELERQVAELRGELEGIKEGLRGQLAAV